MEMIDYQKKIRQWAVDCFGEQIANDKVERRHRFMEEAVELIQSLGGTKEEVLKLVDYVFAREIGEPHQEVGGVMTTLTTLCAANELSLNNCAYIELKRIQEPEIMERIRNKQKNKPKHSPLPQ